MVNPQLRVGIDVGSKTHRVGIAGPDGEILEEFVIPHNQEGFGEFFDRVERHRRKLDLSVAVAMEGYAVLDKWGPRSYDGSGGISDDRGEKA